MGMLFQLFNWLYSAIKTFMVDDGSQSCYNVHCVYFLSPEEHFNLRKRCPSSFCVSFLSQVDELNKLAGLQCMGLHSSAGRALQRKRTGHGFESR